MKIRFDIKFSIVFSVVCWFPAFGPRIAWPVWLEPGLWFYLIGLVLSFLGEVWDTCKEEVEFSIPYPMVLYTSAMDWDCFEVFLGEILASDWDEDAWTILGRVAHRAGDIGWEFLKDVECSQSY